jgi:hypothetical protein
LTTNVTIAATTNIDDDDAGPVADLDDADVTSDDTATAVAARYTVWGSQTLTHRHACIKKVEYI